MLCSHAYLGGEFMGGDAKGLEQQGPAAEEDEAQEPCCDVEGWHNACCQIELVHYDTKDGAYDASRQQGSDLQAFPEAIRMQPPMSAFDAPKN